MRNFIYLIMILGWCSFSPASEKPFKVYVHALSEGVDLNKLDSPYYIKIDGLGKEEGSPSKPLPSVVQINQDFEDAGLNSYTEKMDQLDRDLFYRTVTKENIRFLISRYKEADPSALKQLKNIIKMRLK